MPYFSKKGIITVYVLIFGAVFLILIAGVLGFVLFQLKKTNQKVSWHQALHIAEAGVNYYRWCLNNEIESQCQTQKDYFDLEGNLVGQFSLNVSSTVSCGETIQKRISSEGFTNEFPEIKRKINIIYARESAAKYSYILNDNVWIGEDHEIRGPYHSNGGVRMDGENQSLVTSAKEDWICTSSFGCSPCPTSAGCQVQGQNCLCPGVFTTANGNEDLFNFPITPFDFTGITIDLAQMKTQAQDSGVYLLPSEEIDPQGKGYHLKFNRDGTFEVWIITQLSPTFAYSFEEGWHYDYFTIQDEYLYGTFNVPSDCSVIFVEDNLWPEGVIKGKVSLASANLVNPNLDTDVILNENIDYSVKDGSDGLTLIGERNILIGPSSPNIMELRGIFVAQKGRFSRNQYPGNLREKLEIYGSIISNGRVGTKWVSGSIVVSGYLKRESYFDSNLVYSAPPFTPFVNPEFKIIKWEETE
ncbi:MAG: hypothetical protein DRH33_00095 [Candidatus Nealsonbacteria bacterium]|nr:MAG: hypothetical protein DRH33_00095 [Candidatus Nealsonbacteria bacterium]